MQLTETKDNNYTVTVNGINIHSKYSPLKEAEKFVDQNITHKSTIVVLGAGLGYVFSILKVRYPNSEIIDIPYNIELGKYSLKLNPSKREQWDGEQNIDNFLLNIIHEKNIKGLQIIEWNPVAKAFTKEAKEINSSIIRVIRRVNGNLLTTARFGKRWLKNSLRNYININTYISNIKIEGPIVIVSSGKSLENSINLIKEIRDKITLISLSSANMALDYHNIKPDITFSTDPGYYSKLHLSGYSGIVTMPLTNSTSNNNPVLLINQRNSFEEQLINLNKLPSISIGENGTVAGTALLFSLKNSDKNIYLIGQDLQSTDIETHVKPYTFDSLLECNTVKTNPFYNVKYKRWINEGITYNTYRDWFSKISNQYPNRIYRVDSKTKPIFGIEEIEKDYLIESLKNQPITKLSFVKQDNKTKDIRLKNAISILKNWLISVEIEEIEENSLFYLISTSQYTDVNNMALSCSEIENHKLLCRKESILFIKRLLALYGRQLL